MKAVAVKEAGDPGKLMVVNLPDPEPQSNEILIKQKYACVNHGDVIRRKRGMFTLNKYGFYIPGFEGVGTVIDVGKNVKKFKVGDRVSYLSESGGGYSQIMCIDERYAFLVDTSLSDELAASMNCVATTAYNLTELSKVKNGDYVLIYGGTGGVGNLLLQLNQLKGANVIAVVGNASKKKFLSKYGVLDVIDDDQNIVGTVRRLTDERGVDIIFDCIGKKYIDQNLNSICQKGIWMYYGSTSGHAEFPGMDILMNSIKVQGFNIFNLLDDEETFKRTVNNVSSLLTDKSISIHIDQVCSINDVPEAHKKMEEKRVIGKILIDLS